ncbi:MAG: hypothetical protein KDJ65_24870 [Anaerolineae bacterium]|nr:hypothetical protein [Anaerolineae bacterium]
MNSNTLDSITLLQAHLQDKSSDELIALLIDLVQQLDEPTRQHFLDNLTPSKPPPVELRSPSPETFLAQLDAFAEAVRQGDYFDEEMKSYFNKPLAYRPSQVYKYKAEDHIGLNAVRHFLTEADAYFQIEQYEVAATAYQTVLNLTVVDNPYATLGVGKPLRELGEDVGSLIKRTLIALQQSRPPSEFYEEALHLLTQFDQPDRPLIDDFVSLLNPHQQMEVCVRLEAWADELNQQELQTFPTSIPLQLRLLIRLYVVQGRVDKAMAVQHRFRHRYTMLYGLLLDGCEIAQNWPAIITYGREALDVLPEKRGNNFHAPRDGMDPTVVRTQMAHAYEALGEPQQAFDIYEPVFQEIYNFETYAVARRLVGAISPEREQEFSGYTIRKLRHNIYMSHSAYLLCQIYVSEGQYKYIGWMLSDIAKNSRLDALELVARVYVLTAFGPEANPKMGPYLQALYTKIVESHEEPFRFLRDHLTIKPELTRYKAAKQAEEIYQRIMEVHINSGRNSYATAAYYCALSGEVAAFGGRRAKFKQFYQHLLRRYATYRALKAELAAEVEGKLL